MELTPAPTYEAELARARISSRMRPRAGWCARSICSRNVSSSANEPSIHHRTLPLCSGMIELKLEATADDRLRRRFDGSVARLDVRTVRITRERTRARYHHLGGARTELRRGDTDTDREHHCGHCHPPQAQVRRARGQAPASHARCAGRSALSADLDLRRLLCPCAPPGIGTSATRNREAPRLPPYAVESRYLRSGILVLLPLHARDRGAAVCLGRAQQQPRG